MFEVVIHIAKPFCFFPAKCKLIWRQEICGQICDGCAKFFYTIQLCNSPTCYYIFYIHCHDQIKFGMQHFFISHLFCTTHVVMLFMLHFNGHEKSRENDLFILISECPQHHHLSVFTLTDATHMRRYRAESYCLCNGKNSNIFVVSSLLSYSFYTYRLQLKTDS